MKISFIIPVYNSEKYIEKCVNSILQDKNDEIEMILVDDGSKDKSGKICDKLSENDNRIIVIHQKNKGICGARDSALKIAKGEWICFVDNDDILDKNAIPFMMKNMDSMYDIIYFGFDEFKNDNNIIDEDINKTDRIEKVFEGDDIIKLQRDCLCRYKDNVPLLNLRLLTTPWGKIYRTDFLRENNLVFIEGMRREEDVSFNLMCLAHCRKAKYIDYRLYHYRRFIGSESHSYKNNIIKDALDALMYYKQIIEEKYSNREDLVELYNYRKLWELLYCVVLDSAHSDNPKPYMKKKQDFLNLFEIEEFKYAVDNCDADRLSSHHRILAKAICKKKFRFVCLLEKLENIYTNVKYR